MSGRYIVGTSGYSFADWVGEWYPPGTKSGEMFDYYARHFETTELNYTYYRMPAGRTMAALAVKSPPGFTFWVKGNQLTTHEQDRSAAGPFLEALAPLREAERLAGVLLQFPQSFHRTVENRKYLADCAGQFESVPLAMEFRHASWEHPSTVEGLTQRQIALVVPDAPPIASLYRPPPTLTAPVGYLRLHSRVAQNWYAGGKERYDYDYSPEELRQILADWQGLVDKAETVYAFFNNCNRGQAARNAEMFRRMLGQIDGV